MALNRFARLLHSSTCSPSVLFPSPFVVVNSICAQLLPFRSVHLLRLFHNFTIRVVSLLFSQHTISDHFEGTPYDMTKGLQGGLIRLHLLISVLTSFVPCPCLLVVLSSVFLVFFVVVVVLSQLVPSACQIAMILSPLKSPLISSPKVLHSSVFFYESLLFC